jgi:60 kDa SS-A/Ro ribonucleoprotein
MTWENIAGVGGITPRVGSAAMAMVTARVESQYLITAFSSGGGWKPGIKKISISPRQRLDDVIRRIESMYAGGTDCSLPMKHAKSQGLEIDTFVVYTDNETWAGNGHPSQALQQYRNASGIPAKLVVVGMTSNGFTIADPRDPGMLDVVGFDTATPNVIAQFSS